MVTNKGALLTIENLGVHFDTLDGTAQVLEGIGVRIQEGEVVSLVGETGCGKSVTAKVLLGSLPIPPARVVEGNILFLGKNLLELDREQRRQLTSRKISYLSLIHI